MSNAPATKVVRGSAGISTGPQAVGLITRRSLVQIKPPLPPKSRTERTEPGRRLKSVGVRSHAAERRRLGLPVASPILKREIAAAARAHALGEITRAALYRRVDAATLAAIRDAAP